MIRGWMALGALVIIASAVPLVQVELDRGGAPRATLVVSNRDLMLGYQREENSGVTVTWNWSTPPQLDSLTRATLDSLGVRCPGTGYDCDSRSGTRGWIVVGLDTVPWQRAVDSARRALDSIGTPKPGDSVAKWRHRDAAQRLKQLELYTSRLRMVAAGRDPDLLAARWSDGKHLILPARLWVYRLTYPRADLPGETPLFSLHGDPLPGELYVPKEFAPEVADTVGYREQQFDVTVAVGRRWLPRVVAVTRRPYVKFAEE